MRIPFLTAIILLAACRHSGQGDGTLQTPATATGASESMGAVAFSWKSGPDPSSGSLEAELPDGTRFTGNYLQVTAATALSTAQPYYDAWASPGWGVSSPWYQGMADGFVTHYSGRAVGHLTSGAGTRMRCEFLLREPSSGLVRGAVGRCQLSNGETVFDAQLRSTRG